jgi:hypothetical protein
MTIEEIQLDEIAMSIASAVAIANNAARAHGVDVDQSLVTVTEEAIASGDAWQIEYGPRDYVHQRGGDLIILVDKVSGEVRQVLHGQ